MPGIVTPLMSNPFLPVLPLWICSECKIITICIPLHIVLHLAPVCGDLLASLFGQKGNFISKRLHSIDIDLNWKGEQNLFCLSILNVSSLKHFEGKLYSIQG